MRKPGATQFMGSWRVGHNLATEQQQVPLDSFHRSLQKGQQIRTGSQAFLSSWKPERTRQLTHSHISKDVNIVSWTPAVSFKIYDSFFSSQKSQ